MMPRQTQIRNLQRRGWMKGVTWSSTPAMVTWVVVVVVVEWMAWNSILLLPRSL